jgi:hypothetical protein
VIIRNIKIVGYGVGDCALDPSYDASVGCSSGDDAVSISGSNHVWFDHCDISDGTDGNLDINNGADFITISWTKFHYTPRTDPTGNDNTGAEGHRFSNLIGSSDTVPADVGHLNVTWHHDWWAENVNQRMPRAAPEDSHAQQPVHPVGTASALTRPAHCRQRLRRREGTAAGHHRRHGRHGRRRHGGTTPRPSQCDRGRRRHRRSAHLRRLRTPTQRQRRHGRRVGQSPTASFLVSACRQHRAVGLRHDHSGDNQNSGAERLLTEQLSVVDARISITPSSATNEVGQAHTFTVTVRQNDGSGLTPATVGNVDVALTDTNGASSSINSAASTCDDAQPSGNNLDLNGQCILVVNSTTGGKVTAHATVHLTVGASTSPADRQRREQQRQRGQDLRRQPHHDQPGDGEQPDRCDAHVHDRGVRNDGREMIRRGRTDEGHVHAPRRRSVARNAGNTCNTTSGLCTIVTTS